MKRVVLGHGHQESKDFLLGFSRNCVGISLPSERSGSRPRLCCCVSAVIGLFCRQYDIIKDNDSNNNPKEKGKGPEQSPQGRPVGTRQVMRGWGGKEGQFCL